MKQIWPKRKRKACRRITYYVRANAPMQCIGQHGKKERYNEGGVSDLQIVSVDNQSTSRARKNV